MELVTQFRELKITPKKLRLILDGVRMMSPSDAVKVLNYTPKRAAGILAKAIKSAMKNATATLKVNEDMLKFGSLAVDEGIKMKRYRAGSRGSPRPFRRRLSHLRVVLKV